MHYASRKRVVEGVPEREEDLVSLNVLEVARRIAQQIGDRCMVLGDASSLHHPYPSGYVHVLCVRVMRVIEIITMYLAHNLHPRIPYGDPRHCHDTYEDRAAMMWDICSRHESDVCTD